jgi:hypothetical protein
VIGDEGYLKEPQARVPLGVLFCGNAAFNFPSHGSATSSPKEGNADGAFALRYRGGVSACQGRNSIGASLKSA